MIIQCPACQATAKLPESKEGAKVRCGSCARIYVARDRSATKARARTGSASPTPWIVGGAVSVGLLLVLFIATRGDDERKAQAEVPVVQAKERGPAVDLVGWDSEPVVAAREVHDLVWGRNDVKLLRAFAFEKLHDAPGADGARPDVLWRDLAPADQTEFRRLRIEALIAGEDEHDALVAGWKPFDGEVVDSTDEGVAIVRLKIQPRETDAGFAARTIEWHLYDEEDRWKPFRWERWIAPEEQKAARVAHSKLTEKKTLSDGSIVIEAELKPIPHLEDTPPELRARIDALYATMIDLSLTREANKARAELIAIGKPAIPVLLTGFYEIPLNTEEEAIQVNIIVQALRDITGQYFGYKPQVREGSGTGTSEERRTSALKQWFGWWHRKGSRFDAKEEAPDLYEESVIPNAQERKMLERFEKQKQPE